VQRAEASAAESEEPAASANDHGVTATRRRFSARRFISQLDAGSLDRERERDASPDRDDAFIASNRTTLPLNRDTSRADFATAHLVALSRQSTVLVRPPRVHLTA
jgi:hypothetical protein